MATGQDWRCLSCGRPSPSHALTRACVCGASSWRLESEPLTIATGSGMVPSTAVNEPEEVPMTSTARTAKQTETLAQLVDVYLVCFRDFAATVSDIAGATSLSKSIVRSRLATLEQHRLVTSYDVNDEAQGSARRGQYGEVVWQCWETYDSIDEAQALVIFDRAFGPADHDNDKELDTMSTTAPAPDPVDSFAGATPDDESPTVTPGSVVVRQGGNEVKPDPKPAAAKTAGKASGKAQAAKPKPAASKPATVVEDGLYAALESEVKALVKKPKPEFKVAPSGSYTTIRVEKRPVGYFGPPSRKGMSVAVTITKTEATKLVKGVTFEDHSKGAVKARAIVTTVAQARELAKVIAESAKLAAAK